MNSYGLSKEGEFIAENSRLLYQAEKALSGLVVSVNVADFGIDRDDKEELLTTIRAMLLATGEAGAREIPKP